MENFSSNGITGPAKKRPAAETEEKKVTRVTTSDAVIRKPSMGKRFSSIFFGGTARQALADIIIDVLLPSVRDTLSDAVSQGVERIICGEAKSRSRRPSSVYSSGRSRESYISYNRYSSPASREREERRAVSRRGRAAHDFNEIVIPTRVEAEEVIDALFTLVDKYDQATVADLYDLVGVTSDYTDASWGWTDLRGAQATRVRTGYLLDLPRPVSLS